ncbi:MAG: hypothetical protein HYS24_03435 [Ignavibacteriales bacterium]|nr:hypothetical protein [Ignavibacteriales bacterium]
MNNLNVVKNNQTESESKNPDYHNMELKTLKVESLCDNFSKLIGNLEQPDQVIKKLCNSSTAAESMENYFNSRNFRSELAQLTLMGEIIIGLMQEITSDLISFEEMIHEAERKITNENYK